MSCLYWQPCQWIVAVDELSLSLALLINCHSRWVVAFPSPVNELSFDELSVNECSIDELSPHPFVRQVYYFKMARIILIDWSIVRYKTTYTRKLDITLGWKGLPGPNTLAYWAYLKIIKKIKIVNYGPSGTLHKTFFSLQLLNGPSMLQFF
jgi:hypothetical protein